MADGRRSHTARPEEISYMDENVSEFDPNEPNNDMDARLFRLLSNDKKTDLSKRQPLPRDRSLGLRIPSARFLRGLDLHKGESHGPVPALVTSPVHDHADDIVGLRPAHDDAHAGAASATPSRATPAVSGYAPPRSDHNDYSYAHRAAHPSGGGGGEAHNGGTYDHNAFDRAVDAGSAPTTTHDSGEGRDHAYPFVVGLDNPYAAPAAYDAGGGHGAGDYANQDEGPDAFSLAVQEVQQHGAGHDDEAAAQARTWSLPLDGSAPVTANAWQEPETVEQPASTAAANDHTWFGVAEAAAMAAGPHDGEAHHHQQQQEMPADTFSVYPPQYAATSSSSSSSSLPHNVSAQDGNAYDYRDNAHDQRDSYPSQSSQPGPSSSSSSSAYSHHRPEAPSSYGSGGATAHDPYAEERKAKHAALLNLSQIEESGGVLSRKFTMDDPYDEIEYELDAYHHRRNHIQSIEMVHDKLRMVETILMLVNGMGGRLFKRKGPIIAPDALKKAWQDTLDKHKVVIENVARKRYGPHAGSSAQSPEIQLGTALAMGISGPILMGLFMDHLMGGGGGNSAPSSSGDRARDGERQRRRRDDKRPALRRHRDAASGSDWRSSHNDHYSNNNNNGGGNYPEPPQDPFSRVPSLHTPHPQHVASWASPNALPAQQAHAHVDPTATATATAAQPNQYVQANWESPLPAGYAPQGAPTPQMDPYAHAGSPWHNAHGQSHPPVADYQQQQHQQQPHYPQQSYYPQQQPQPQPQPQHHQQQAPLYMPQEQQPHTYAPQAGSVQQQQQQQRQHAQQTPYAAGGERVAHTHVAPVAQRAPAGPQQPPAHHEATPRQQPQPQQQATPSGAAPQGRRLMGRIAKPR